MKTRERILVMGSASMWAIILFWLFGSPLVLIMPVVGLAFVVKGGGRHA